MSVLNGPYGSAPIIVTQTSYDPLNRPICTAERNNAAVFASLPAACSQSINGGAGPDHITQLTYDLAGQTLMETACRGKLLINWCSSTGTIGHCPRECPTCPLGDAQ